MLDELHGSGLGSSLAGSGVRPQRLTEVRADPVG